LSSKAEGSQLILPHGTKNKKRKIGKTKNKNRFLLEKRSDQEYCIVFVAVCVTGSSKCSLPTSLSADRTQVFVYSEDAEGHSVTLMSLKQTARSVRSVQ